jgi:hypothetical protein
VVGSGCAKIGLEDGRLARRSGYPLQSGGLCFMNRVVLGSFESSGDELLALDPRCNMYEIGEELGALNGDTSRTCFAFPALRANANDVSWMGRKCV